jgi:hypothetical protein
MVDLSAAELQQLRDEGAKLGPNGAARVQAVEAFIHAQAGDRGGDVIAGLTTAAQVEGIEKLMASFRTQQRTVPHRRWGRGREPDQRASRRQGCCLNSKCIRGPPGGHNQTLRRYRRRWTKQ